MEPSEVVPANSILFEDICLLLEQLVAIKKNKNLIHHKAIKLKQEQAKILENFIINFKIKVAAIQGKKNSTFFPILRLLLPDRDRDRNAYNLKMTKLGNLLVKVLALNTQSPVAQKLLTYRSVSNTADSDFAGVAYYALKNIITNNQGDLTVGQINEILDRIANAEVGNKKTVLDEIFTYALKNLSILQIKWFLRLILKEMKLGVGMNLILATFHPDAPELFESCSSLSKVCEELEEGDTRPVELGIKVFYAISPMLSERLNVTHVEQQLSFENSYYVEEKFDGERFQIHMANGVFEYFSRKGHSYSDNYGKTYDAGTLTPFLKGCFNSEVSSFILDGEMMGWHKFNQHFSCKGIAFDVKKITENSRFRPCFCAFDILYYNGDNLVGTREKGGRPLKDRLKILDSVFTDVEGVIQHSKRELVKDSSHILDKLNKAIESQEEGIVVKDIESFYIPSKRNAGWYKIKPEYTDSTMTDLDLVIIGADEAENKRQGRAKSFHVACVDPGTADDTDSTTRWYCVARVATGLSHEERESICIELEKHWVKSRVKPPPPHLVFNKEVPDFWVLPEKSTVLQVRATELIRRTDYGTSYTLRFPRVTHTRPDKPVFDAMTLGQFEALLPSNDPVIKLSTKQINQQFMDTSTTKVRRKRPSKVVQVSEQFRTTISEAVEVNSKALLGRKICILSDNDHCKKPELRRIIESHSGTFVSNVGPDTWCAVVGQINRRESEIIKSQEFNVADTSWLRALPPLQQPYTISPLEMITINKSTRLSLSRDYDLFGDSYSIPVNKDTLRKCFDKMDRTEPKIYLTRQEMTNLDRDLFSDGNPFSFLRPCLIHVSNNSSLHAIKAKMYGAVICDLLTANLTHVVICKTTNSEDVSSLKKELNALIVSEEWLEACFKQKSLVPEAEFIL